MKPRRLDEPQIGGHHIACFEHHEIARHEIAGIHLDQHPVPTDAGANLGDAEQRLHRAGGAQLGEKPDRAVQEQHDEDRQRLDDIVDDQREHRCQNEKRDDHPLKLMQQDAQCASGLGTTQSVRAVAREARGGLLSAQPVRKRDGQTRDHRLGGFGKSWRGVGILHHEAFSHPAAMVSLSAGSAIARTCVGMPRVTLASAPVRLTRDSQIVDRDQ